jgi:hypothetical protein
MTLTIEVAPEEERALQDEAERLGQTLDEFLRDLVKHRAAMAQHANMTVRLAALDAIGSYDTRAGLPPLDISGSRADVYGYTEREDEQQ